MLLKRMVAIASLVVLSGCGGKATGVVDLNGMVTFTYVGSGTGGLSGNYSANGAMPTPATGVDDWAASDKGTNTVFVTSMQPRAATTHDLSIITIRRQTVGTETLTAGCSGTCSRLYIMFGAPNTGATNLFLQECTMTVGTISITAISSSRVSGTFSGTGTCTSAFGATVGTFTVTNGSFDTAILPNV